LMVSDAANALARSRRRSRKSSACCRSTIAIPVPSCSACTSAETRTDTVLTSILRANRRMASTRPTARHQIRLESCAVLGQHGSANPLSRIRASAASNPRPASLKVANSSSANGRSISTASMRLRRFRCTAATGSAAIAARNQPRTDINNRRKDIAIPPGTLASISTDSLIVCERYNVYTTSAPASSDISIAAMNQATASGDR